MASQITDSDIQTFSAAIDAAWSYASAIVTKGVADDSFLRLRDVTAKAKEASDLLNTACEQRGIYEQLDAQIKAAYAEQEANGTPFDPLLPETMKRNAVNTIEYTTNRMAFVLYELQNLTAK